MVFNYACINFELSLTGLLYRSRALVGFQSVDNNQAENFNTQYIYIYWQYIHKLPFSTLFVFPLSHILSLPLLTSPSLALYLSCLTPLSHLSISMCQDKLAETHISFSLSLPLSAHHSTGERETERRRQKEGERD